MLEQVISNKAGWTRVAFGDVVRLSKERTKDPEAEGYERVVGLEHIEPGDLRIRRWADIADGTTFTSVFKSGQVLFGKRRAYQRKVAVADFAGVCSGDIYVLKPSSDALMPELLPFICQTDAFFDHAVGTSAGSLSPRTNWKGLADFEFLLPPIQEQARLVEVFVQAEQLWEHLRTAIYSAGVLRESVFANSIAPDHIPREEINGLVKFSSGKLIKVSKLPKSPDKAHGIPVIGGNGIAAYTTEPLPEVPNPCIAVGRVGEYCGTVHYIPQPCWVSDNALFVKSHSDRLRMRYLELCLRSLRLNNHSTGGAQPLMTQAIINRLKIPVPSLEKQDTIILTDGDLDASIEQLNGRWSATDQIKRQLLNECF